MAFAQLDGSAQKGDSQVHDDAAQLLRLNKETDAVSVRPKAAPAARVLASTTNSQQLAALDARSQLVKVPIDEVEAIGVKAAPTFERDDIQSVTLKAFRKVVGYDTFNSILRKDRHETKDPADYYNVTVSMMIKRNPLESAHAAGATVEGKPLAKMLDKGFPYDEENI